MCIAHILPFAVLANATELRTVNKCNGVRERNETVHTHLKGFDEVFFILGYRYFNNSVSSFLIFRERISKRRVSNKLPLFKLGSKKGHSVKNKALIKHKILRTKYTTCKAIE